MTVHFIKLTQTNQHILQVINSWENDSELISLTRPNQNEEEQNRREKLTLA